MDVNQSITLRPATADDDEFRRELSFLSRRHEVEAFGWSDPQKRSFLEMQFRVQNQSYALTYPHASDMIIQVGDKQVGRFLLEERPLEVVFIDLGLVPEFQRQGIGTYIFKTEMQKAALVGKPIRFGVLRSNVLAIALYERLGFSVFREDPMYLQMQWTPPPREA